VSKITDYLLQTTFTLNAWSHVDPLELANFNIQGLIDILLGADFAPTILTGGRVAGHQSHPTAFGSIFGWVLMGPVAPITANTVTSMLFTETALFLNFGKLKNHLNCNTRVLMKCMLKKYLYLPSVV